MKQPRLPGTEKFKFASSDKSTTGASNPLTCQNPKRFNYRSPEASAASSEYQSSISKLKETSPLSSTLSVPSLYRTESKRRAVLPITCQKTSRMLHNTNLDLNMDHVNLVTEDVKSPRLHPDNSRVPSCPNLESSSRSLNASKTSLDTYFRKMSLQNSTISESPTNLDWKNIRASPSRLSMSCSSSCSSEESVWVLRKDS